MTAGRVNVPRSVTGATSSLVSRPTVRRAWSRRLRVVLAAGILIGLAVYPPAGRLVLGGLFTIERQVVASFQ